MAGAGYRTWTAGEVVTASNVQSYLQDQTVGVYAGTAARSSAILSPSEGQVSYRTDDDIVEVYDGTAWQPIAPADTAGLVHIETRTVSAVASESFNNVFSATYDNYKLLFNLTSSTATVLLLRTRAAGSDATGSDYINQGVQVAGGSVGSTTTGGSGTSLVIGNLTNSNDFGASGDLLLPFVTNFTKFMGVGHGIESGNNISYMRSGVHKLNTSYDGFTVFPNAGNITGTISLYGYAKV